MFANGLNMVRMPIGYAIYTLLALVINIKKEIMEWKITDPSCNQMMKQLSENKFLFKEDRIINPVTKETETYESEIDLKDYTQEEMFNDVESFGYSFNEMCNWIDEGTNLDLIAECIFEMEC